MIADMKANIVVLYDNPLSKCLKLWEYYDILFYHENT